MASEKNQKIPPNDNKSETPSKSYDYEEDIENMNQLLTNNLLSKEFQKETTESDISKSEYNYEIHPGIGLIENDYNKEISDQSDNNQKIQQDNFELKKILNIISLCLMFLVIFGYFIYGSVENRLRNLYEVYTTKTHHFKINIFFFFSLLLFIEGNNSNKY
jgi:hypothetical protein